MTAQIDDLFLYGDKEYSLVGISESEFFEPSILALDPQAVGSHCWRGYKAVFSVLDSRLILESLYINLPKDERNETLCTKGPTINGVAPKYSLAVLFNNYYEFLNYHLDYSGGLLLANDFIREFYKHMGFHPSWKYKNVIELIFENGELQNVFDRSQQMAETRQLMLESTKKSGDYKMMSMDEIRQFVVSAFDRKY